MYYYVSDAQNKIVPFLMGNIRKTFYMKEVIFMECKSKNSSIRCTVQQCQHNMQNENYCTLQSIDVGTHESNPTVPECTDCNSFVKRS